MTESATMTAALRSGQIDYRGWTGTSQIRSIDEAESLRRTNPEARVDPVCNADESCY